MAQANQIKILRKAFSQYAERMVDAGAIYEQVKGEFRTDLKEGDYAVTTCPYDSSIFVVDPVWTDKLTKEDKRRNPEARVKKLANPYEEEVVRSAVVNLSVKASAGIGRGEVRTEMRIKVRKLNLLGWVTDRWQYKADGTGMEKVEVPGGEYPRQSDPIIFRQTLIDLRERYGRDLAYARKTLADNPTWMTAEQKARLEGEIPMLEKLVEVPPFVAYETEKYGMLVKREVRQTQILMETTHLADPKRVAEAMVGKEVARMEADASRRIAGGGDGAMPQNEEVVAMAMHPDRMGKLLEKHGWEGAEETFEAKAEGVGKGGK